MKKTDDEPNDQLTGISPIPPLIEAIQLISQFAFSVEPEPYDENIEDGQKDNEQNFQESQFCHEKQENNQLASSSTNVQLIDKLEINKATLEKQKIVKQNITRCINRYQCFLIRPSSLLFHYLYHINSNGTYCSI